MAINVLEGVYLEDQPRKWVLAGDGVIGEVTCTRKQVLAMAAGPDLLQALHQNISGTECWCRQLAKDCPDPEDPPMCDRCFALCVIDQAEGRVK
jgi:hypothetical protein